MRLAEYTRKRDFKSTAEPRGFASKHKSRRRFVVQKHAASRLHYDFRLEMDGVLKSWAVPKGLPFVKGEKRLAVHVEDHPVSYIDFEGTIPKGQYGGGTVMVWDHGLFSTPGSPLADLNSGKLHFTLDGHKLRGDWYLVQLRGSDQWLLIKGGTDLKPPTKKADDTSSLSGKSMQQIADGGRVFQSEAGAANKRVAPKAAPSRRAPKAPSRKSPAVQAVNDSRPSFIEPMKARLARVPPAGDWFYEIKFDGFRALALLQRSHVQLLSRTEKDFGEKFPEIVAALRALDAEDAILDGEIVALDKKGVSSFQLLQAFELGEQRPCIYYYVFDLLRLEAKDLRAEPLRRRKALLEKLLRRAPDQIRFSAALGQDAARLLKEAASLGLEGLIGKRTDSAYEAGQRSGAWIKLKLQRQQEFVIGGYSDPEGTRQHFGALLLGFYQGDQLKCCGKVGAGFNEATLESLAAKFSSLRRRSCPFVNLPETHAGRFGAGLTKTEMRRCHWIEPELVAQIKFSEWTRDQKLRQPVFLGLREDKPAHEVVQELPDKS